MARNFRNTMEYHKNNFKSIGKLIEPLVKRHGQLVERGFLKPGDELTSVNKRYVAKVRPDGTLITHNARGSIHRVGAILEGSPSCNGWNYWHVRKDGELIPIDYFRQKARTQNANV